MAEIIRGIKALLTGRYHFGQLWNYFKAHHFPEALNVKHDPPRLGVFLTVKCNMKCDFCLTHSEVIPDNPYKYQGSTDMTMDTFKDILARFPNTLIISFIGNGEPILNKDVWNMVDYALEKKMRSTLFTNGLVLDRFIDKIVHSKIKTFNISLNAIDHQEFKRFTGYDKVLFDKVVKNTKELTKAKNDAGVDMEISATILVDKHNYKSMGKMIEFAEECGIDHLVLSHFMPWTTEGLTAEERSIYTDNIPAMEYIEELSSKEYNVEITYPTIFDKKPDNRLCRDNVLSMSIDGDGNVSGCERKMLNTENNGKYWEKGVFNNKHFKYLREIFITKETELPDPCVTCFNNTTCETKHTDKKAA